MNEAFWQYFLAADLPRPKALEFLGGLASYPDPATAFLSWPRLTTEERAKASKFDMNRFAGYVQQGVHSLTISDYPERLQHVASPPDALFAWGDTSALHRPTLAIVGTRSASSYGKSIAKTFAYTFASLGVTVVSGGAFGIDTAAHQGVIEAGGRTVAVLGTGIDRVYPATNAELYKAIKQKGCLVSQFALGTPSLPHNFLARNQIIAALADAVLLIEAPDRSGAINTVMAALDMGREVFVVPGPINQAGFKGSHRLIRDGATLIDHPMQVAEEMGWEKIEQAPDAPSKWTRLQQSILDCLSTESMEPEGIMERTGLEPNELMSELTMLEMEQAVVRIGKGYAVKT